MRFTNYYNPIATLKCDCCNQDTEGPFFTIEVDVNEYDVEVDICIDCLKRQVGIVEALKHENLNSHNQEGE